VQYGGRAKTAELFDQSKGSSNVDTQTTTETPDHGLRRLAAEIVAAYVSANSISTAQLPDVIRSVVDALTSLDGQAEAPKAEALKPVVPIRKSVTPDYLVCLEDGKKLKMLKRHLRTTYDMSPQDYREKWGLPADYPMVAPNYAARRSEFAKQIGLGRKMIEEKKAKRSRVKKVRATSSEASPA
jgi:predicted transcriptional regulator